jgi:hypothetical protein
MTIAGLLTVLGLSGGILHTVIGLVVLGEVSTRPLGIPEVSSALTGLLVWLFIGALAQTVAADVQVMAATARNPG